MYLLLIKAQCYALAQQLGGSLFQIDQGVTPVKQTSPKGFVIGVEFWKGVWLPCNQLSLSVDLLKLDLLKCNVLSHIDLCVKIKFSPAASSERLSLPQLISLGPHSADSPWPLTGTPETPGLLMAHSTYCQIQQDPPQLCLPSPTVARRP